MLIHGLVMKKTAAPAAKLQHKTGPWFDANATCPCPLNSMAFVGLSEKAAQGNINPQGRQEAKEKPKGLSALPLCLALRWYYCIATSLVIAFQRNKF